MQSLKDSSTVKMKPHLLSSSTATSESRLSLSITTTSSIQSRLPMAPMRVKKSAMMLRSALLHALGLIKSSSSSTESSSSVDRLPQTFLTGMGFGSNPKSLISEKHPR